MNKQLRPLFAIAIFFLFLSSFSPEINAKCVSLTSTAAYSEDFDSLAATGTGVIPAPAGFVLFEIGSGANNIYTADNGFTHLGDTYSYGNRGSNERALGVKTSGSVSTIHFAGCFTNNTGVTIPSLLVQYTGEQWRSGTTGTDTLNFHYSTDAIGIVNGTYIAHSPLNFTSVVNSSGGALDGNAAANRIAIQSSIPVNLANGATVWLRWTDTNALGSDDGLAVDNLILTPQIPTAAGAIVSGRITNQQGAGLSKIKVTMSGGGLDDPLYATTNAFGFYKFEDIPAGETYILSVQSKQYFFDSPTRVLTLGGDVSDADFVGRLP